MLPDAVHKSIGRSNGLVQRPADPNIERQPVVRTKWRVGCLEAVTAELGCYICPMSLIQNRSTIAGRSWVYPRVDCYLAADVLIRVTCYVYFTIDAVKAERLSDLAGSESYTAVQSAVVAALNVVSISVAWPPTDHVRRWRDANYRTERGERDIICSAIMNLKRTGTAVDVKPTAAGYIGKSAGNWRVSRDN
jgi:hypothetical protein